MAIQTRTRVTKGKAKNIDACADDRGIIRAAAMDQRGSLMREIGKQGGAGTPESLTDFKTAVTKALTPYATAILMDPEYGLPALKAKASDAGVLLAYEKSGYDADPESRMPDVLDRWTVRRQVEAGANGIKVLIYYDPFDDKDLNLRKEIVVERIGAECAANDVPLFVEPLAYKKGLDEKGLEFVKRKPEAVKKYMATFSEARFGIDILKVEVPVNMAFVQGSKANKSGDVAYTTAEALRHFKEAADAAVDLEVRRGEVVGLLGPNGAGEGTTIGMVLGLITPTAGAAEVLGRDVRVRREDALAGVGAMLEVTSFYPYLSGRDNLAAIAVLRGGGALARVDPLLARLGLAQRGGSKFRTYSLGMRQRLGIASTLLAHPALVVLDGPANGPDPAGARGDPELLRELRREEPRGLLPRPPPAPGG